MENRRSALPEKGIQELYGEAFWRILNPQSLEAMTSPQDVIGAPGRNRTCGTWIRNPLLYPLGYRG